MKRIPLAVFLLIALLLSACSVSLGIGQVVRGSGVLASETRSVSGFDALELAGSAEVAVTFGETESVVVEAEDNLLPLLRTRVQGGKLVIDFEPNTTVVTTEPIRVTLVMKALTAASLTGSGNILVSGLTGDEVKFVLSGSGNITADGAVDSVDVTLNGSGNILCADLQAKSVSVDLRGSGNVDVYAGENLDATITGSGNVTYRGSPAKINTSTPGSGDVRAVK